MKILNRRLKSKSYSLAWLAVAALLFCAVADDTRAAMNDMVCKQFAETLRAKALAIIHNDKMAVLDRQLALRELFEKSMDFPWVERKVASDLWDSASPAERLEFDKVYRAYVTNFYIGGFEENQQESIADITLTNFIFIGGDSYRVIAQIIQKDDDPVDVEFVLAGTEGHTCRIHDFSAEGISMLVSQHDEMQSIARQSADKGGLATITEQLSAHIKTMPQN